MFDIWIRLMENSAIMSVMLLAMLIITRLTYRKVAPQVRMVCWIVIAAGLLMPIRPALLTVRVPAEWYNTGRAMANAAQTASTPRRAHTQRDIAALWEASGYSDALYSIEYMPHLYFPRMGETYGGATYSGTGVPGMQSWINAGYAVNGTGIHWYVLLPIIWGVGVIIFLLGCVVRHIRFMKGLRRWAVPCADPDIQKLLAVVCHQVGIRPPQLRICPLVSSPMVVGIIKPLLILPACINGEANRKTETQIHLILLHEAMHIKRRDNAVRLLALVAGVVHWFNPLVYLMRRAMHNEAEMACDADVLRHAGDSARLDYGQTIFNTAKNNHAHISVLASAMSGEGKNLKRRLADILEKKRTRRGIAVFFALIMVGGVLLAALLSYEPRETEIGTGVEDIGWRGDGVVQELPPAVNPYTDDNDINPGEPPYITNPIELGGTDRLVIYIPTAGRTWHHVALTETARHFRAQYPDVELVIEFVGDANDWGNEAYRQRVSTELMAGMGPDIILTHLFDDIMRIMDSGVFMNLSPLWHRDPDFTERYELDPVIMDAGVHRGRRYVVPISFNTPVFKGERGMLESVGFDVGAPMNVTSFLQAVNAVTPAARENPLFYEPVHVHWHFLRHTFPGRIPLVDFETGEILPYEDELRTFMQAIAPLWGWFDMEDASGGQELNPETLLIERRILFYDPLSSAIDILIPYSGMYYRGYEMVMVPIHNVRGEIHANINYSVAVNANSPNYENAWRFIRLMLSEPHQYTRPLWTSQGWGGIPVNRAARDRQILDVRRTGGMIGTAEGHVYYPALTPEQKQPLFDIIDGITSASLRAGTVNGFLADVLQEYIAGAITIDDAMDTLRRQLHLYMTE